MMVVLFTVVHCGGGGARCGRDQELGLREQDPRHPVSALRTPRGEAAHYGRHAELGQGGGAQVFRAGTKQRIAHLFRKSFVCSSIA